MFRAIPLPPDVFDEESGACRVYGLLLNMSMPNAPIWNWCRTTAWNHVKECMRLAGVCGKRASPKALRHAFAVGALEAEIPITLVGRWLGHARLTTTEIYTNVVGREEQMIAKRLWDTF
jgi:site-specific recombinase XerD